MINGKSKDRYYEGVEMKSLRTFLCGLLVMGIAACGSGGGGSVTNSAPAISSISPASAPVGSAGFTLTVTGTNFDSSSIVDFNGDQLNTLFVSTQQLQAKVGSADLAAGGTVSVAVYNQSNNNLSNSLQFAIVNSIPTVSSVNPFSASVGSSPPTLVVSGNGFVPASTVLWNGKPLPTTYRGSTLLWATPSATDISNLGTFSVVVENPSPGGGNSSALEFQVFSYTQVNETANDVVWDAQHQLLYLSIPSTAVTNPNSITALDPFTNAAVASQPTGNDPNVLAISDNGQYLYAGIDGTTSVQRFTLPNLQPDINFALGSGPHGPYFAFDMQVAPVAPNTTAIILGNKGVSPEAEGGIVIYDNATPRPTRPPGYDNNGKLYESLQWGTNASTLYAANSYDLFVLTIDSNGASLTDNYQSVFNGFGARIHYDPDTGFVYDDNGQIANPTNGVAVGQFSVSQFVGVMTIDSNLNRAYFVYLSGVEGYVLESFNLTQFTPVSIVSVPQINGTPERLVRWGSNGLALIDSTGSIYLASGPFVTE